MRTPRKILSLLAAGFFLGAAISHAVAQEEAPPAATPPPAPPAAEPPPYPLDLPGLPPPRNPPGLFPDNPRQNPPATTTPGRSKTTHRSSQVTGSKQRGRSLDRTLQKADTDPLRIRVAYRRDKTVALARDPELTDLLRRADTVDTDVQKRAILREYYTRLFSSIRRIDPSAEMKGHLTLLAQVAEQRYDPKRRVVAGEEDLLETRESASNQRLGR